MVKWKNAKESHPETAGSYLTISEDGIPNVISYDNGWNCWRDSKNRLHIDYAIYDIAWWAELPAPPKGWERGENCYNKIV